jgi:hypothetical protein
MVYTGIRTQVNKHHSRHRCRCATVTPLQVESEVFMKNRRQKPKKTNKLETKEDTAQIQLRFLWAILKQKSGT